MPRKALDIGLACDRLSLPSKTKAACGVVFAAFARNHMPIGSYVKSTVE